MEEKIKISISSFTNDILLKDAENFIFYKDDKKINKNLFLNTLIVNYYEEFSNNEREFNDNLLKVLDKVDKKFKDQLFENIIKVISKKNNQNEKDSKTVTISFKPTKMSNKAVEYINNILINNESISSYYRKLFSSYAHKPQNERELVIFKENYEILNKAIKDKLKVCISLKNGVIYKDLSIYKIASSKDELFNYVLFVDNNMAQHTLRLAKINNISILPKQAEIPVDLQNIFERQIKYGVQYPIFTNESQEIIVKMTDRGKELFKRIYLYRPIPYKIENDLYFFECSYNQVGQYFRRFGKEAVIISPSSLVHSTAIYYYNASRAYDKLINKKK